jgi:phage tail sheath protein FI
MAYMHGVRIKENPTSVPTPVSNESGVTVIFGTAPINLASDPENATNKLFLCKNFEEAQAAVGYSDDYENYTLCMAVDAFFKAFKVGPIVICNVLDPEKHKKEYTETLSVVDGQAVSTEKGILLKGLTVKNDATDLVEGQDYTAEFDDDGYLTVTVIASGISTLTLAGNQIDPSKVTTASIIGSYDAETGKETGMELVRKVYPSFGLIPGMLIAPGWSQHSEVGLALDRKCEKVNGMFTCETAVDISSGEDGAQKYTDVVTKKEESGYNSNHVIALWPMVKYAGKIMYYSAIYAAMVCYRDYKNENVPNLSPSNVLLGITATVLENGEEVNLDLDQANELNGAGIVTAININGFKSWGNNTTAYPGTNDPKDRWICCRRFFSWWGNNFITTYLEKVDSPADYRQIESIVDSENVRGNSLVSQGKCAGIKMVYSQDDNPIANVLDGKVVFRQYLAPYTPAEDILNILEFDPSMIETALGGE